MVDYFASSTFGMIAGWLFGTLAFASTILLLGIGFTASIEERPTALSVWFGLCFLVAGPVRYFQWLCVVSAAFPFQSFDAFFSTFILTIPLPLVWGLFFLLTVPGPVALWMVTVERLGKFVGFFAAPAISVLATLLCFWLVDYAAIVTHWQRAEDVIRASNGPGYYVFTYVTRWFLPLTVPSFVSEDPDRYSDREVYRAHVATVYLGRTEFSRYVQRAHPDVYARWESAAQRTASQQGSKAGESPGLTHDRDSGPGAPELNADEQSALAAVMENMGRDPLTSAQLDELRSVLRRYVQRTGYKYASSDCQLFGKVWRIGGEYRYEVLRSMLVSWDRQAEVLTTDYRTLSDTMEREGLRSPELLRKDRKSIRAAAHHVHLEDASVEMRRDEIVEQLRDVELKKEDWRRLEAVCQEFAR